MTLLTSSSCRARVSRRLREGERGGRGTLRSEMDELQSGWNLCGAEAASAVVVPMHTLAATQQGTEHRGRLSTLETDLTLKLGT